MSMSFHEWWMSEFHESPTDEEGKRLFHIAHQAWRAAFAHGSAEVAPIEVDQALLAYQKHDPQGAMVIRHRIAIADLTIHELEAMLEEALAATSNFDEHEEEEEDEGEIGEVEDAARTTRPPWGPPSMPEGGKALDGRRWQCPRCNRICGVKRAETKCRTCSYPGDDTRSWTREQDPPPEEETA